MDTLKSTNSFDGSGDVKAFTAEVDIVSALKGYADEKRAQAHIRSKN